MGNFKVGDIVIRTQNMPSNYALQVGNEPTKVVSLSGCGQYVRVGHIDKEYAGGYRAEWFVPYVFPEDTLPPVPESVRYNDEYPDRTAYKQTWLDVKRCTHRIYLESGQYGTGHGVGMEISPEAALQLAHDLRRMAMEIKRKEK